MTLIEALCWLPGKKIRVEIQPDRVRIVRVTEEVSAAEARAVEEALSCLAGVFAAETYEERAAICEYDGKLTRAAAERQAVTEALFFLGLQ